MTDSLWAMDKASGCSTIKHVYVDLTGDLIAGMVLSQLVFWFTPGKNGKSKLRVNKHGRLWLARQRDQWAAECRISPKQFDRASKLLEGAGLIEIRLMMFDGKKVPHLWLNVPELTNALSILTKGQNPFAPKVETHLDGWSKPITDLTTDTTTDVEPAAGAAPVNVVQLFPKSSSGGQSVKASDVLNLKKQDKQAREQKLSMLWKSTMADTYGGFHKDLVAKDRGILKHLMDSAQEQTRDLVVWAICNWPKFAHEVKMQKGLQVVPERPVPGFLLQHHDVALQLIAKSLGQAQVPAPKVVNEPVSAPTLVKQSPAKPVKTDQSVVQSALAELNQVTGK